ncbi:hypothetical protein OS493_038912 [Desmophyllum pertusum]|uniref:Uncharacterized protein n=1 Tax=Desmophyllum pertusum TaxID=174260 RepID=A0A9X0CZM7_9CNID|nr:hypothetical protein OS493_038912 [Desmophyllum pertusum]
MIECLTSLLMGRLRKRKANQTLMIKEENHSEIERRRRNKMNAYINELSDMVPSCNGLARKPDKLTVLRMAAADGFLFVVNCMTGTVVYVSDSITPVLNQPQSAWMNQEIFDLVHPDDADKIKDQISATESPDAGRVLDLKTGSVKKDNHGALSRMYSNSRRNFICRMRCGKEEGESSTRGKDNRLKLLDDEYAIVHCTGYIKDLEHMMESYQQVCETEGPNTVCEQQHAASHSKSVQSYSQLDSQWTSYWQYRFSILSPRTDLSSPESAASLYQRRAQQLISRTDEVMCHYSPGGAVVPKVTCPVCFKHQSKTLM